MNTAGTSIAVVGAGAVGLTAAYDLARRGREVTVFERGEIAAESTGRAAGVLYDAYAEDRDAAIGRRSMERFRAFSDEGDFRFHETPYIWFAHEGDGKRADAIDEQVPRMQKHGIDGSLLDSDELSALAPTVRTDDIGVAAVARNAGWTEPATYAGMMAEKARREGVEIRTHTPVSITEDGIAAGGERERYGTVIVAAGAHTKRIVEDAGYSLSMKPYRVQALVIAEEVSTPMVYDATAGFYLRPHDSGLLVGDGTEEIESDPEQWDREGDEEFIKSATARVRERFDVRELSVERAWAGLCTATPDGNPLMGWLEDGVYVATGWQGHGFMRAPALGERIAEEVCDGPDIEGFDPTRFSSEEAFPIVEGMAIE